MYIPADAIIAEDKLTMYLLVLRPWDDKSGFLRQAGFEQHNWRDLETAIRTLTNSVEATEDGRNPYGEFYRIEGPLSGLSATLQVVLIWMRRKVDQRFHFVTLKPSKE
ncbi:MAG: hypothetical protein QOE14_2613 [Humisphaera sp.]|nr:hypothetical protein [Humisphaera sp.]